MNRIAAVLLALAVAAGLSGCDGRITDRAVNGDVYRRKQQLGYIYGIPTDEKAGVISHNIADVYSKPDVKSDRITQALYNQPVSILSNENGWTQVKTVNGFTGWIKSKYIDNDISSIYGRNYTRRIIVTSREKTVYAYPSGGYADNCSYGY